MVIDAVFLPDPLNLEEIQAHAPRIGPVPQGLHRPFWSVMIPTYNCGEYLRRALKSVLCQDPGPKEMQIEVVDACSTTDDPKAVVEELSDRRVEFYRLRRNRGPANTFNNCIARSRGRWIHILHGDDMVLPGFYEAYAGVIRATPQARTIIGQVLTIDECGRCIGVTGIQPPAGGGIVQGFAEYQATRQLTQFPAVAICREAYEAVGGFCSLFDHVCDWDMWFRLAQHAPVASVPFPYALYRVHNASQSHTLMTSAKNTREIYFVIKANLLRLKRSGCLPHEPGWQSRLASAADTTAWLLDAQNSFEGRYNQAIWAWMLEPRMSRLGMVLKSWLKHTLKRWRAT